MKKYVLGISGYIGSGKTTAGKFFHKLGAIYIDADTIVGELYVRGAEGYRRILDNFGKEYFKRNGDLNRNKLATVVFGDKKKLRILENLIHPLVMGRIKDIIKGGDDGVYVIEATYFKKKHLGSLVDGLVWIESSKDVLFRRLSRNRHIDRDFFEKILNVQFEPPNVDFTVRNNGSKKDFEKLLYKIWFKVLKR
jgi:dephospho-CoA kinase